MNTGTGELVEIQEQQRKALHAIFGEPKPETEAELRNRMMAGLRQPRQLTPEEAEAEGFTELPPDLNRAARRAIAQGRNPISLTSGGKLSRWAKKQRSGR